MTKLLGWLKTVTVLSGLVCTATASATTGYFTLGYGAKSMGMAGATVSNPQDSIAAATNPAGMGLVGERMDVGLRFFSPSERSAKLSTSALGTTFDVEDKSRRNLFLIPNFGYTSKINDKFFWGISFYGNGGMNSTYDTNLYDETAAALGAMAGGVPPAQVPKGIRTKDLPLPPPGTSDVGTLGIDLSQGILAPTLSMQVHEKHTIGVSLLLGAQRFSARGLGNFQCFTKSAGSNPDNAATCPFGVAAVPSNGLTNNGNDWAYGAGVRVGWIGDVLPQLTLGAAVASKVYMTEFDDYDELFAEDGDLDVPANFTVGLTYHMTPAIDVSFDFQRILYEGVNSISNPGPVASPAGPALPPGGGLLGTSDGLGFGWEDIDVYRIAASYQYTNNLTFRAGYAYNDQPIPNDQVLFNILAPATPKQHAALGFTYSPDANSEFNFAYMHAFEETVSTNKTAFGVPGEIKMYQNSIDVSYSLKF